MRSSWQEFLTTMKKAAVSASDAELNHLISRMERASERAANAEEVLAAEVAGQILRTEKEARAEAAALKRK